MAKIVGIYETVDLHRRVQFDTQAFVNDGRLRAGTSFVADFDIPSENIVVTRLHASIDGYDGDVLAKRSLVSLRLEDNVFCERPLDALTRSPGAEVEERLARLEHQMGLLLEAQAQGHPVVPQKGNRWTSLCHLAVPALVERGQALQARLVLLEDVPLHELPAPRVNLSVFGLKKRAVL